MAGVESSITPLVNNAHAVAEWEDDNNVKQNLGCRRSGPCDEAFLSLDLDTPRRCASIKLKVAVGLKSARLKVNLYLFIPPEIIGTMQCFRPDQGTSQPVHDAFVRNQTSSTVGDLLGLRMTLKEPAFVVCPKDLGIVKPKTKDSSQVLDRLRSLCAATSITLYLTSRSMPSLNGFRTLCDLLQDGHLHPISGEVESAYRGIGGRKISWGTEDPPSYDDLEPGPPLAPLYKDSESSRKRAREDDGGDKHADLSEIERLGAEVASLRQAVAVLTAQLTRQTDLAARMSSFERSVADLRTQRSEQDARVAELVADATQRVKCEMTELLDERVEQLRSDVYKDMEHFIDDAKSEMSDRVDVKIDDRAGGMKDELEEALRDGMEGVKDEIKAGMEGASVMIQWP